MLIFSCTLLLFFCFSLAVQVKWEAHIAAVEQEEDMKAMQQRQGQGPKLRGSVPTATSMRATSLDYAAGLGSLYPSAVSSSASGGGMSGAMHGGSSSALQGNNHSGSALSGSGGASARSSGRGSAGNNLLSAANNQLNSGNNNATALGGNNSSNNGSHVFARSEYEHDQMVNELMLREKRLYRLEHGFCRVPPMVSPWMYAALEKAPRVPKWPEEVRKITVKSEESTSRKGGRNSASAAAAREEIKVKNETSDNSNNRYRN